MHFTTELSGGTINHQLHLLKIAKSVQGTDHINRHLPCLTDLEQQNCVLCCTLIYPGVSLFCMNMLTQFV